MRPRREESQGPVEYLYTYHRAQHEEGIGGDARGMISAPADIQHRERSGSHDQMSTRLLLMVVGQTIGALGFQTSVAVGDLGGQPLYRRSSDEAKPLGCVQWADRNQCRNPSYSASFFNDFIRSSGRVRK
jgi:hypothetical protein